MKRFVLILFLVFQTAFACTPMNMSYALGTELPSWLDGTAENLIFLQKQGISVHFNVDGIDQKNLEWVALDGKMRLEIPALKISFLTRIHPDFSIEEMLIMGLIRESKWNFSYTGWDAATFKIGNYEIKMSEYSNPFNVIYGVLSDKIEEELGTKNSFIQFDECGWCYGIICNENKSIEYNNKTNELIISVTFTGKFTVIQFLPPKSVTELYFASPFLYFDNKIEKFEFYRNRNNVRIGQIFLFKLTKNIDMNKKVLEFISPETTTILKVH